MKVELTSRGSTMPIAIGETNIPLIGEGRSLVEQRLTRTHIIVSRRYCVVESAVKGYAKYSSIVVCADDMLIGQGLMLGSYDPARLFDELRKILGLHSDAEPSRVCEVPPPMISKIRHGKLPVKAALLIRFHEVCGLSIADLRHMFGDRRRSFRVEAPSRWIKMRTRSR